MRPQVGQVINNKYRLLRLIGDGGMGSVYEARHEVLGMSVALKFLHPELSRRPGLVERFLQEAKVSAQIQSPHVVRVSDVDKNETGQAFIVLEYLEGRTLQTLYEDLYRAGQRLSYADAMEYAMQMIEGVEAAHRTGIVHRDLKPDNVMITKGAKGAPLLKLLDFGIAKLKVTGELDRGLTRPGVVMGTPEYMAPEQAFSAKEVDARADIFSLGVMIFEMIAGRRPVGGDEPQQIATAYLTGQVAQLTDLAPGIAPELAAAVHKAMGPLPKDRFDAVTDLRDALEPFAAAVRAPLLSMVGHPSNPGLGPTPAPAAVTPASMAATPVANAAVPKTLPPEADGASSRSDVQIPSAPATPLGGFAPPGSSPIPAADIAAVGLASTATNPPYAPRGVTSMGTPRPGGTAVSDGYNGGGTAPLGPAFGGDFSGAVPVGTPYGVAPLTAVSSAQAHRKARKSGPPLLVILLLAGGVAGTVVGGLAAANHLAKIEDNKEKEQPIAVVPSVTVKSDPPASDRPPAPPPVGAPAKPPPVVANPGHPTGPVTPGPKPSASTAPTSTVPPGVIVIPSSIPTPTFPFPVPPFGPFTPPGQQPDPPPPGGNTSPPGGTPTQPPPGGGPTPAPSGSHRPGGIIIVPRH
jgi:eukaryotic-like serine/threonine-protein kinase